MPVIELGVNFEDVKHLDEFEPVPNGDYQFIVAGVESKNSQAGRPMLKWTLNVTHDGKERKLFYNTVLPWVKDDGLDTGGLGMLVQITKALGKPWTGQALSTEDYIGLAGMCQVIQKPKQVKQLDGSYAVDPEGGVTNDIKKFIY